MTADTETKPATEQTEEVVKKEEEVTKNGDEKSDDKAEKPDKEKEEKKEAPPKKEPVVPKPTVHKVDYKSDVVYLYQLTRTPVLPSLCPYCLKVETWLRLAGVTYENVNHRMKYKSKKGQLPFVEINGEEIADSAIIIKELGSKFNVDLDATLTPEQKNVAHATISMIENHFAWVLKAFSSRNPDLVIQGLKLDIKQMTQRSLPAIVLNFLFKRELKAAAKKVRAHGIGVHKPEEIEEFGHSDLKVLSDLLGDKSYFFGDSPTMLDIVAFANLAQVVFMDKEVNYTLRDWLLENCANLNDFCTRMKERAFWDWDDMCANLDLNSHLPKPPKEEEPPAAEEAGEKQKEKEVESKDEKEKEEKEKDDTEQEKTQKEEKEEDNKKVEEK